MQLRLYFTSIVLSDASHATISNRQPFLSLPKNTSKETKQIKNMNFAYLTIKLVKHYPVLFSKSFKTYVFTTKSASSICLLQTEHTINMYISLMSLKVTLILKRCVSV